MSALSAPYFHDEAAAYDELEATLWPHGPVCPHCRGRDRITPVKVGASAFVAAARARSSSPSRSARISSVSHVPLNLWLQATSI